MSEYGLRRLVLLNSANYDRAEIPLDDSVSIIGPNNAGKTSMINALQFLLISDRRNMDFGAHDESSTLKFYFPSQSSYILLEAQLESGLVVLGCVGKGASHEYQHFAYKGSLMIDDFRRENGTLVQEPDLRNHLAEQGRTVHYFPRATEFFDALYGKTSRKTPVDLDLRLYKLESLNLKTVFQKILVRTLRLDKLQAEDVKEFLLQIFMVDYGTGDIDFHKIWHRAFDTVNGDRLQYQACRKMESRILDMNDRFEERLNLRGEQNRFEQERLQLQDQQKTIRFEDEQHVEERSSNRQQIASILAHNSRQKQLELDFMLIKSPEDLTVQLQQISQDLANARVLLQTTKNESLPQKERDFKTRQHELNQLKTEREQGEKLLGSRLQSLLSSDEMDVLNGLIHNDLFRLESLNCGNPLEFARSFQAFLKNQNEILNLWGITVPREKVIRPYRVKSREELDLEIAARTRDLNQLQQEISALRDRVALENRCRQLETAEQQARKQIEEFSELETLRSESASRQNRLNQLTERQTEIEQLREQNQKDQETILAKLNKLDFDAKELTVQHNAISSLRGQRKENDLSFQNLESLRHNRWFSSSPITPENLVLTMKEQSEDCKRLLETDSWLREKLRDLYQNGFTKFQGIGDEDEEIQLVLNYAINLDHEEEVLQKASRSAVTTVAHTLKELKNQYEKFQNHLQKFNQLIGKRKLSDLDRFRIELREHSGLLDAIRTIVAGSESIDLDFFDMINAGADSIGDRELDRAKDQLLKFSSDKGSLRLDHLFGLEFEVAKAGHPVQRFDQLDKIGSNGTVLMAKLISGLALLYQMLDINHTAQTICYLDEAASLDDANQQSLIATAQEFGFNLFFASPTPQNTVRYCVPIEKRNGRNSITMKSWQIFEDLEVVS